MLTQTHLILMAIGAGFVGGILLMKIMRGVFALLEMGDKGLAALEKCKEIEQQYTLMARAVREANSQVEELKRTQYFIDKTRRHGEKIESIERELQSHKNDIHRLNERVGG